MSNKIKIYGIYCNDNEWDYDTNSYVHKQVENCGDWEIVSNEDLRALELYLYDLNEKNNNRRKYFIIRDIDIKEDFIQLGIQQQLSIARESAKKLEDKKKRKKITADKRAKTAAENKKKRDLQKLKELQEKYNV